MAAMCLYRMGPSGWIFLRWVALSTVFGLSVAVRHADHQQPHDDAAAYQEELIRKTAFLRPGPHFWAGYEGPWVENAFFSEWELRKPQVSRIYLPVAWTDCFHKDTLRGDMQQILNELDPAFKYFTVLQIDLGFNHHGLKLKVPPGIDILLFSAGGDSPPHKAIPIPLLKNMLEPDGRPKTISVSFQGSNTSHIRKALHEDFADKYLFLGLNEHWKIISESSNFSFCPRGFGLTSFRLYETLRLGTIPIYVWDEEIWLPFQELVNWDEFAIVVSFEDRARIPSMIAKADVGRMKAALDRHRHMFSYEFTVKYIMERLFMFDNLTPQALHGADLQPI